MCSVHVGGHPECVDACSKDCFILCLGWLQELAYAQLQEAIGRYNQHVGGGNNKMAFKNEMRVGTATNLMRTVFSCEWFSQQAQGEAA